MKFLYSRTAEPKYHSLSDEVLLINNTRSLEFVLADGETIHYPIPGVKGKITAVTTHGNTLVVAESAYTVKLHIFTIQRLSKANVQIRCDREPIELNSLDIYTPEESTKTFFNTLPCAYA